MPRAAISHYLPEFTDCGRHTTSVCALWGEKYSQKWQLDEERGDENELFSKIEGTSITRGAVDRFKLNLCSK